MNHFASSSAITVFTYGTLMRSSGHHMAKKLQGESRLVDYGSIPGKLYSLGDFPGLVLPSEPDDRVYGEVISLINPAMSLAWMDDYEGCGLSDPEPHAYERIIIPVTLQTGGQLHAWVYIYKLSVLSAELIPDGRFLRY
jgi:gamma-glutamylcyclotransferase (GGCT)/AIG2-like uncharacterized protein YtfP